MTARIVAALPWLLLTVAVVWLVQGRRPDALVMDVLLDRTFLLVATVLLLESAVVGWHGSSLRQILTRPTRSTALDLALFGVQFLGLMRYATLAFTLGLGYVSGVVTRRFVALVTDHDLRLRTGSIVGDVALYFLVVSLVEYWNHRLLHTRYLWPLHRVHHSATELNGITSWRNHPALFAWEPLLRVWVTAFFSAPPGFLLALSTHQFVTHCRLPWSWGLVGRFIIVSPLNHRLHHAADPRHSGRNFSVYLVLWDRLFGTYGGDGRADEPLGLADGDQSFRGLVTDVGHLVAPAVRR